MSNIFRVFYEPSELFEEQKTNPKWLFPLIIIIVVVTLSYILIHPIVNEYKLRMIEEKVEDEEQREQIEKGMKGSQSLILSLLQTVLSITVLILLQSLFLYITALICGGSINYKLSFSVVTHSNLIMALGSIITSLLIFLKKSIYAGLNFGVLLPETYTQTFIFALLHKLNFFSIWMVYIMGLGIAIVSDLKKKTVIPIVYILWIIWIVITSILQNVFV